MCVLQFCCTKSAGTSVPCQLNDEGNSTPWAAYPCFLITWNWSTTTTTTNTYGTSFHHRLVLVTQVEGHAMETPQETRSQTQEHHVGASVSRRHPLAHVPRVRPGHRASKPRWWKLVQNEKATQYKATRQCCPHEWKRWILRCETSTTQFHSGVILSCFLIFSFQVPVLVT